MYHIQGRRNTDERGLSLLEVLISMVILAVGILGLAPMVVLSIEGNEISRDFAVATELAKERLEFYEAYGVLLPKDSLLGDSTMVDPWSETLTDTLGYSRWIGIAPVDSLNPPTLCKVDIIINWTDNLGTARSTKHSTLMVNN